MMKKHIYFLALLLLITSNVLSQDKKISLEVKYPIPLAYSSKGSRHSDAHGIIDLNIKYQLPETKTNIGLSYSFSFIKLPSQNGFDERPSINHYYNHFNFFWNPKTISSKIQPFASIGYTLLSIDEQDNDENELNNGMNLNFGIQYNISNSLFIKTDFQFINSKYEYFKIKKSYRNNFLKLGAGYQF